MSNSRSLITNLRFNFFRIHNITTICIEENGSKNIIVLLKTMIINKIKFYKQKK